MENNYIFVAPMVPNSLYNKLRLCLLKAVSLFILCLICGSSLLLRSQVAYGDAATYGLRKIKPTYAGSAIQVRRTCDDAIRDIGFTSCGDLDTNTLKTFVVAANPLSSISTTATAAYSLRRLSCSYAGSAIQVRRSSDNATSNIGFTSWGDLDTATMKTFVGANSAFVTIWYDQSGNGRNAVQATAANQPRIMNAGVVEYQNNRPSVRWLGMTYSLSTAGFTAFTAGACFNGVAKVNTNVTYNCIVNKCTNNFPAPLDFYNNNAISGNGATATFFAYGTTFNNAQPLGIWTYHGVPAGSAFAYYNSALSVTGAVGNWSDNGNPLILGSRIDGVTGLNGWISEVITWGVVPSPIDRNFVEWTQSAYYNITGPLLTPIPAGAPSGYITNWYDQSGNGFTAAQTATANQPRIINVGVIEKSGTKPAIKFNGFPFNLVTSVPVTAYPLTISALANTSGASTFGAFVKHGGVNGVNNTTSGIGIGTGNSGGTFDNTGTSLIGLKEWVLWCPSSPNVNCPATPFVVSTVHQNAAGGNGLTTFLNGTGVPLNNAASAVGASITGSLYIGGYSNVTNRFPVFKENEVIIFGSALNNTRRTLLETNQASHYNITISNTKYTPPAVTSYNYYVNGVGRETATDSVAGTRSSVGMGFTIGTAATDFLKDNGDYITAGVDCPLTPTISVLNLPPTVVARWYNDWYVNKTDVNTNNGNISFYFSFTDYGYGGIPGAATNYVLLYRTSPAANFTIVPGVAPSVSGNRVQFLVDASNIVSKDYYTIGTTNAVVSPLPVELFDFTAKRSGKEVNVNWQTMSEWNFDHFTIQRSADAVSFSDLGDVKAYGTSNTKRLYQYVDTKPLRGVSYYRLKQVDADNNYKLSSIAMVEFDEEAMPAVYPNPTTGSIKVSNCKKYNRIMVIDVLGKLIYTGTVDRNDLDLDLSTFRNGSYFITIFNSATQERFISKVILDKSK